MSGRGVLDFLTGIADWIKAVAAFGILITLFSFGLSFGKGQADAELRSVIREREEARATITAFTLLATTPSVLAPLAGGTPPSQATALPRAVAPTQSLQSTPPSATAAPNPTPSLPTATPRATPTPDVTPADAILEAGASWHDTRRIIKLTGNPGTDNQMFPDAGAVILGFDITNTSL